MPFLLITISHFTTITETRKTRFSCSFQLLTPTSYRRTTSLSATKMWPCQTNPASYSDSFNTRSATGIRLFIIHKFWIARYCFRLSGLLDYKKWPTSRTLRENTLVYEKTEWWVYPPPQVDWCRSNYPLGHYFLWQLASHLSRSGLHGGVIIFTFRLTLFAVNY